MVNLLALAGGAALRLALAGKQLGMARFKGRCF
jgi:hypothetical protein